MTPNPFTNIQNNITIKYNNNYTYITLNKLITVFLLVYNNYNETL